jgi:hypothetical protein
VRLLLFFFACCLVIACSTKKPSPQSGYYTLVFRTDNGNIPTRLSISDSAGWQIINAAEVIQLDSVILRNDSFFVKLPLFDSSIKGTWRKDSLMGEWTDHSRKDYSIPFMATIETWARCESSGEELNYDVVFSPEDTTSSSKGVAVLQQHGTCVTGTVLTETGDYRYLQGELNGDSLWLSAFDGTHLFYLTGRLVGDSIIGGVFLSGKHWKEPWSAYKSAINTLRNPASITSLLEGRQPEFTVHTSSGQTIRFDSTTWKNHVSIVQIMGSWCPNCTDESRFLKTLFDEHTTKGLRIIPVAFERGDDTIAACARVQKQFTQLGLSYPFYYGGQASKTAAHSTFTFLDEVHSFPTTIFIDRQGKIRKIFTGFYGPGTGEEYTRHTKAISTFVDSLMTE